MGHNSGGVFITDGQTNILYVRSVLGLGRPFDKSTFNSYFEPYYHAKGCGGGGLTRLWGFPKGYIPRAQFGLLCMVHRTAFRNSLLWCHLVVHIKYVHHALAKWTLFGLYTRYTHALQHEWKSGMLKFKKLENGRYIDTLTKIHKFKVFIPNVHGCIKQRMY